MLTLKKDKTSTEIVELHSRKTRSKKADARVYYTHNHKAEGNVAPAAGVLELHKASLKKIWKLSNSDYDRVCVMIDTGEEPDSGEPLRTEYWELHKVYERALRNEMYLGDQEDLYFEHNLDRRRDNWCGTFLLVGNSGAGKTHWMVQLFLRYMRAVKPFQRRTLIYISPEWEIDRTLKPLKEKRYAMNVIGVDVSEKAVRASGMDVASYFQTKVVDVFDKHGEKAIIVFDDFMDAASGMDATVARHRLIVTFPVLETTRASDGYCWISSMHDNENALGFVTRQEGGAIAKKIEVQVIGKTDVQGPFY